MNQIKNDGRSIIFYGAGENAERNFSKWVSEGLVPVCFADMNVSKHYTKLQGVEILPLEEAVGRYPDYVLCITTLPGSLLKIRNYLIEKGIPTERIVTAEPYEYRKGCSWLGKHIMWDSSKELMNMFRTCCFPQYKHFVSTGNPAGDFEIHEKYCKEITSKWKNEEPTHCDGCVDLRYDYWETEPKLKMINICTERGDYCNFRCIYCFVYSWDKDIFKHITKEEHTKRHNYIMAILQYVRDNHQANTSNFQVRYSCGELMVSPYCDEIIDFWRENKMDVILSSNWSIYNQNFADFSRDFGARLHISLDSGTPETFLKIKGVDCFDKVVDNLVRFSENGGRTIMKFLIIEGINDNKEDIIGFLTIAKRIKSHCIQLWEPFAKIEQPMNSTLFEWARFFTIECHALGLNKPVLEARYSNPDNKAKIDKLCEELWGY